jgi:hypothetical protein
MRLFERLISVRASTCSCPGRSHLTLEIVVVPAGQSAAPESYVQNIVAVQWHSSRPCKSARTEKGTRGRDQTLTRALVNTIMYSKAIKQMHAC